MTWTYCIDISGACNLACPSCPSRGFSFGPDATETRPSVRLMSVDLFSALMEKIVLENPNGDVDVCLYVWGEPLLHNKIGAIITMVRERGFNCVVATNLNATSPSRLVHLISNSRLRGTVRPSASYRRTNSPASAQRTRR